MKLRFLFFLIVLASCKHKEISKTRNSQDTITVYNETVFMNLWRENQNIKVKVIDTHCMNQRKRAKKDIKQGNLIYFDSQGWLHEEMSPLLASYNITIKQYMNGCLRSPGFNLDCYEEEMWEEIYNLFGDKFIDSLQEVAERNIVIKNPDKEYFRDGIDLRKKYLPTPINE
jgi:hypothetical protein